MFYRIFTGFFWSAETVAKVDLSRVASRDALRAISNNEPYWHRLAPGRFLGFSPSAKGGAGTWFARAFDQEAGKYRKKLLGAFDKLPGSERFAKAKKEAETFADLIEAGGRSEAKIDTVADAAKEYAKTRPEVEARFKRYVYEDSIAKVKLSQLRRRHLADWRKRLEAIPALVSRSKKGPAVTRARSLATVNRDVAMLRAALNKVHAPGIPNTENAWQEGLLAHRNVGTRRDLYLDRDQRRKLLEHISSEAEAFVRALCMLPLRPGAVAGLTVADFNRKTSELTIRTDKAGGNRRIALPGEVVKLLTAQAADKLPGATLFTRTNGLAWEKNSWGDAIEDAAKAAELPAGTVAYTLRHSGITDMVVAGVPLLTVAQITGTSIEMIQAHYGHLTETAATDALAKLAL